ncbi:MAG TPA: SsrA-binding protein SmpB [Candidatus Limnocylindrales bacterium]|nr:SsrA-binding protein SmpB [Candidatus Limnocylindrales bacterium]
MKIANKRAFFDFEVMQKFEAGIHLTGAEVKAIRLGHADLTGSFVRIMGNEAYLIGSKIFPYAYARPENYDTNRTRKLLLHKRELISLKSKIEGASLTIVPVSWYTTDRLIKLELALGKSKKKFDKKAAIKKRDLDRELEQDLKIK